MNLINIRSYLFNIINEVWKRESFENLIKEQSNDNVINDVFEKCCNSGYTNYYDIEFYDFQIENIYECINFLNNKNNEIFNEDISIVYLLNENKIKSALFYFIGIEWRDYKVKINCDNIIES